MNIIFQNLVGVSNGRNPPPPPKKKKEKEKKNKSASNFIFAPFLLYLLSMMLWTH